MKLTRPKLIRSKFVQYASVLAALVVAAVLHGQPIGQWDFNSGNLSATVGSDPLSYIDGPGGATDMATEFKSTTTFGIPDINGQVAQVMKFPANTFPQGYQMPVNSAPNPSGSSFVNQWTIIFDVLYPPESEGKWRAFIETDNRIIEPDADFFVNPAGGIGISGQYDGKIVSNTWYRVGFVVDTAADSIRKYINGVQVGAQGAGGANALEGRWALDPVSGAGLFTDNDGDVAVGYVNSIQLWNVPLTAGQMLALGGPSASGIPQTIPPIPSFIESRSPAPNSVNQSPLPDVQVVLNGGDTTVTTSSIKLSLDGTQLPATVTPSGATFTIAYTVTNILDPLSVHSLSLVYQDSAAGSQTNNWSFTVADYKVINLPAPIALETFDTVPEGTLPTGWVATNATDSLNPVLDLNDPSSDSYLDWVVISRQRVIDVGAAPNGWNASQRLNVLPVVVNGKLLTSLISTNFAYAESDTRGGNQVQVLFSPDYDLSGNTNIYLSFHSIYTQNQDDIASVEYSIDQGATWLPIVYMLDGPDIIKDTSGQVDAIGTLTNARGDQAYGMAYGTWIGAEISTNLAPYISERVNDDQFESKRVELFRLPQADNQSKVRLRFMQAGTASWFFGIDDVGFYSIELPPPPTITKQPFSQVASAGAGVTLQVVASGAGPLAYQWTFNGTNLPSATSSNLTLTAVQPSNVGDYRVSVSNAGGPVLSSIAHLDVFSGPVTQDLVVHLKFDNDLNDSSGRGNNATPVGSPTFVTGKVGPNAVNIPSGADYVSLGAPPDLNFGMDTDFSIAFWTQVITWSGDPSFIGNKDWSSGGNQGYVLATDSDAHFQWNLAGPPGSRKDYDGPPGTFSNGWHHVVVTFDRQGNAFSYVDGSPVADDPKPMTANQNNVDTPSGFATNIGQDGTGTYGPAFTDADIDDLGIWRRVLTPQEVAAIYSAGQAGNDLSTAQVGTSAPTISSVTLSAGSITINWTGAAGLKLQKTTSLSSPNWQDVNGTDGASTATESAGTGNAFYRLIKP